MQKNPNQTNKKTLMHTKKNSNHSYLQKLQTGDTLHIQPQINKETKCSMFMQSEATLQ